VHFSLLEVDAEEPREVDGVALTLVTLLVGPVAFDGMRRGANQAGLAFRLGMASGRNDRQSENASGDSKCFHLRPPIDYIVTV
jgi:hypothetical protein